MRKRILSLLLALLTAGCLASPGALADGGTASPEPTQTAPADGWLEKNGETYYLADGEPVTGWRASGPYSTHSRQQISPRQTSEKPVLSSAM